MRLKRAISIQNLSRDDIGTRLRQLDVEDGQLVAHERTLCDRLDTVTAVNSAPDVEAVSLHLAQVQNKRQSLSRVRAALLERQLDARARMMGVRYVQLIRSAIEALAADAKVSQELRHAIYGLKTLYAKFRRTRQEAWQRLNALNAGVDGSTQRTWDESSILYLLADSIPLAELRREIQSDIQRRRLLSLREWQAQGLLHRSILDGSALQTLYPRESPESLKRIAGVLQHDSRITKILSSLELDVTNKQPQSSKSQKKQSARKQRK